MEPLKAMDALAAIARQEVPPETNVRIGLLAEWQGYRPLRLAPLAWSAAVSALAAGIIVAIALHQSQATTSVDSISPFFNATQVQLPQ